MSKSESERRNPQVGAHRVVMLGYEDAQILDITGPLEVFGRSGRWIRDHRDPPSLAYEIELIGMEPGPITTSSGLTLGTSGTYQDLDLATVDTLLVTGGIGWQRVAEDEDLQDWLRKAAELVPRLGSICTGAMILARAGLFAGRSATTHWAYYGKLREAMGDEGVVEDALFVHDRFYSSAGVTSGMDMALAMVEADWDRSVALAVARELVLFLQRPGGQSQFSTELEAQVSECDRIQGVQTYIRQNLAHDLSVDALAECAAMSPRHFARRFTDELGITPHRYVERVRVDAARRKLESSGRPIGSVAQSVGFGTPETLRRAFVRQLGVTPSDYRQRFDAREERA